MPLYLLLVPLLFLGQDSKFSTDVKVVNVLATVHDKKGQIFSNLTKEDFAIEEEGRPQVIQYFSRETNLPLTLGLLVDTSMSQRRVIGDEQRAAYRFVDQVMTQKDQTFVIHFDRDVELLQDFTNSRQKLERALSSLETPLQLHRGQQGQSGSPGRRGGGGGTALYDAVLLASNDVIRDEPGRKAVIVLSDGVDNGSRVGLSDAIQAAQRHDVLVYSILFSDEQAYGNGGMPPMRGGRGGGGRPHPNSMPRADDGKKVLERLSMETGGGFFEVSKKQPLDRTFAQIQDELRNQYSLGFTSDQPASPGSFRRLLVTTPKQKNLTVQARDGYYAK